MEILPISAFSLERFRDLRFLGKRLEIFDQLCSKIIKFSLYTCERAEKTPEFSTTFFHRFLCKKRSCARRLNKKQKTKWSWVL